MSTHQSHWDNRYSVRALKALPPRAQLPTLSNSILSKAKGVFTDVVVDAGSTHLAPLNYVDSDVEMSAASERDYSPPSHVDDLSDDDEVVEVSPFAEDYSGSITQQVSVVDFKGQKAFKIGNLGIIGDWYNLVGWIMKSKDFDDNDTSASTCTGAPLCVTNTCDSEEAEDVTESEDEEVEAVEEKIVYAVPYEDYPTLAPLSHSKPLSSTAVMLEQPTLTAAVAALGSTVTKSVFGPLVADVPGMAKNARHPVAAHDLKKLELLMRNMGLKEPEFAAAMQQLQAALEQMELTGSTGATTEVLEICPLRYSNDSWDDVPRPSSPKRSHDEYSSGSEGDNESDSGEEMPRKRSRKTRTDLREFEEDEIVGARPTRALKRGGRGSRRL